MNKIKRFWANNIGDGVRREFSIKDLVYAQQHPTFSAKELEAYLSNLGSSGSYGLYDEDLSEYYQQEKLFNE